MKKHTRFILAGLATLMIAAVAPGRAAAQCGDVNNNGVVSSDDIVCLSSILAGLPPPIQCNPGAPCTPLADCNLFNDPLDPPALLTDFDNTDLAVLVDDFNGIETLHDPCTSIGSPVACGGPADPETGDPTLSLGGGGDVTISASQIWPNTCTIILEDSVFFETPLAGPTTVLTIQAGTVVKGEAGNVIPVVPALFILPGSKISAIGTPASPIVFTSTSADGAKLKGDWGGVNVNGRSIVNRETVGPCLNTAEGIPTPYGGCIPTDSSGIAQFVRVEFAGLDFTVNNELNLFTMNAVGSGTSFRFIQAHAGDDDCHEWFGGTINQDHLVASGCADDGFDSQLGFQGSLQFGLLVQNGSLTDPTIRDSRGIESDNSEFDNLALPRTNPDMCNLTMIGARAQAGENGGSDAGMLFRRGAAGTVANSIVTGFQDAGLELRDSATTDRACNAGPVLDPNSADNLRVRNTVFFANGSFPGGGTEHCKNGNCVNASGQTQSVAECTAAAVPFACCTGAGTGSCLPCDLNSECVTAPYTSGCNIANATCSSCDYHALLVASENVTADGSNLCNPTISDQYPLVDVPDYKPTFVGACPVATACSGINDTFVDTTYLGAINPAAAACTPTSCDWLSSPWLNFDPDGNAYP